jgi:hypothetical protein
MEHEVNSERVQLGQEADEILQGAAQADRPTMRSPYRIGCWLFHV